MSKLLSSMPAPKAELKQAIARAVEQRADALLVHVDALFNETGESQIVGSAASASTTDDDGVLRLPGSGGLIGYGADVRELNPQAGYVARIVRGEKLVDLLVAEPTNFALRINLKTCQGALHFRPPNRSYCSPTRRTRR